MQSVHDIACAIVAREGGYVNDPDDPGGPTKYGVTLGTMQRLGRDLNRDGRVNTADVRALTRDQATEIYVQHYFHAPGIAALPVALQPSVFDMYVNAGSNAVKILQRLFNMMRIDVTVDGMIGPQTIAAAATAYAAAPRHLADAYGIERRNYYYGLGDARPASRKYCVRRDGTKGGWIIRAEEFVAPIYHLSHAAHRARVAAWV
jgi:lysozyme family protein